MSYIRDHLDIENQKRLTACQTLLQEIFGLGETPNEEMMLAISMDLCIIGLNSLSCGREDWMFFNIKEKTGLHLNLTKFFLTDYEGLKDKYLDKEEKELVH